jgi:hypothetical protein
MRDLPLLVKERRTEMILLPLLRMRLCFGRVFDARAGVIPSPEDFDEGRYFLIFEVDSEWKYNSSAI